MRKLLLILPLLCLMACQKNFDELNDTDQRNITFSFNPSGYFSEVLLRDGSNYHLCTTTDLDPGYGLRITGYCYGADSVLVAKTQVFGDLQNGLTLNFKHLYRDTKYHFLFLADIVEYDSDLDYYEIWFQLLANNLKDFYVVSFERRDDKRYNVLLSATLDIAPENKIVKVEMKPIAYNGYVIFKNLGNLNWSSTVMYYNKMLVNHLKGQDRTEHNISYPQGQSSFILSLNPTNADNLLTFRIKKTTGSQVNNYTLRVQNSEHRPFVATIDFASGTPVISDVIYY